MVEMIRFKNKEEFDTHFKAMADESGYEFNDNLCIEGNSGRTVGWLRKIAEQIGYNNVSVEDDLSYSAYYEFDVSKAPKVQFDVTSNDTDYYNGVIRLWFD